MELLIALFIAVPVALVVTWAAMRLAARHNRAAARWDYYCARK
jgi:hypothetical protein